MSAVTDARARDEAYRRHGIDVTVTARKRGRAASLRALWASRDDDAERGGVVIITDRASIRLRAADLRSAGLSAAEITGVVHPDGRVYLVDGVPMRASDAEVVLTLAPEARL